MSAAPCLPLADLAEAAGVSHYRLTSKFWPSDWACPRDFRFVSRSSTVLVAVEAVPALVTSLREGGEEVAAGRLQLWLLDVKANFAAEDHVARPVPPTKPLWYREGQFA